MHRRFLKTTALVTALSLLLTSFALADVIGELIQGHDTYLGAGMGPERAAARFLQQCPDADRYVVTLYGSLAKTGKGHGTETAIEATFAPIPVQIDVNLERGLKLPHENPLDIAGYRGEELLLQKRYMSIGGGDVVEEGEAQPESPEVYKENSYAEIAAYCKARNIRLSEYVRRMEGDEIFSYLSEVWDAMQASVLEGLSKTGVLPGGLGVERRAQELINARHMHFTGERNMRTGECLRGGASRCHPRTGRLQPAHAKQQVLIHLYAKMGADGFTQRLRPVIFGDVGNAADLPVGALHQHFPHKGGKQQALGTRIKRDHHHAVGIAKVCGLGFPGIHTGHQIMVLTLQRGGQGIVIQRNNRAGGFGQRGHGG